MRNIISKILLTLIGILGCSISSNACHHKEKKETTCTQSQAREKINKNEKINCLYGVPSSEFKSVESKQDKTDSNNKKKDNSESKKKNGNSK